MPCDGLSSPSLTRRISWSERCFVSFGIGLLFVGAFQARERLRQGIGDRSQRHAQNIGNLAIAKALRPQVKTGLIPLRQRLKNRAETTVSLGSSQLLFGIWGEIDLLFYQTAVRMERFANPVSRVQPLQREIVHHAKKPAPKIFA